MKRLYILIFALLISSTLKAQSNSLDTDFGINGVATAPVGGDYNNITTMAIQKDGKIVVAGERYLNAGPTYEFRVVRYNTNGTLDTTFGTNGIVSQPSICDTSVVYAMAIQSDGKIVVSGNYGYGNIYIITIRYKSNGALDSTFGKYGTVITRIGYTSGYATGLAIQTDEKLIVAGYADKVGIVEDYYVVVRYNTNGTLDSTYGKNGIATTPGNECVMAKQADDKVVVAGQLWFTEPINDTIRIARFTNNGKLDTTFGTSGIVNTFLDYGLNGLNAMAIQKDGKIVINVNTDKNSVFSFIVVRYNIDGTLDNTFGTNGVVVGPHDKGDITANTIAIQSSDKIVIAGYSDGESGTTFAVLRYNTNGTLDSTFGLNGMAFTPIGGWGYAMAIQTDDKIVVGGSLWVNWVNSKTIFEVARYLSYVETVNISEFKDLSISIYPNPVKNMLTIETSQLTGEDNLLIYNLNGQVLLQQRITANIMEIDLGKLSKGIYIIKYTNDNVSVTKKIVKD